VSQLVEALCWFDSRWCHWYFALTSYGPAVTQPLTEMSTRIISWLSLPEPSGPAQACTGIALTLLERREAVENCY